MSTQESAPLTVLFASTVEDPDVWLPELRRRLPADRVLGTDAPADFHDVDVAVVSQPPRGLLGRLPHLRLVQSLWMGVDGLLADPDLPRDVPVARMVDPGMTTQMPEAALAHVLWAHRQLDVYARQQQARRWRPLPQPTIGERTVGVLGLGELGCRTARRLALTGFDVSGWSRRSKALDGVATYHGDDALHTVLAACEVLVVQLSLTPSTRHIVNAELLARLPAGAVLVNLARGEHVVDDDLLAALDAGHLRHAVLDAFMDEPLPPEHPFWGHPRVTVTPHVAAVSTPAGCAPVVAANIARLRRGAPLLHLIDRTLGY